MSKNKSRKKQSRSVWSKTALLLLGCCAVNLPLAYAEDYIGDDGKWLTIFGGEKREYDNVSISDRDENTSLYINPNASLTVKNDLIIDKYDSRSSGISYGLTADGTASSLDVAGKTVIRAVHTGDGLYAVHADEGASINLHDTQIFVQSKNNATYGLYTGELNSGSSGQINIDGTAEITVQCDGDSGNHQQAVGIISAHDSTIKLKDTIITLQGTHTEGTYGIYAFGGTYGTNLINVEGNCKIAFQDIGNGATFATTTAIKAYGTYGNDNTIRIAGDTEITGNYEYGLSATIKNSAIELQGGLLLKDSEQVKLSLVAEQEGAVKVNSSQGNNLVQIIGDVAASSGGTVDLALTTNNSFVTANMDKGENRADKGQIDLKLLAGVWKNIGDSNITSLDLGAGGTVDLVSEGGANAYQKVSIDTMKGTGGRFYLDTDLQNTRKNDSVTWDQHSDQIIITNNETGSGGKALLQINDASLEKGWNFDDAKDEYKALLVTDHSQNMDFETTEIESGGLYNYKPLIEMENNSDEQINKWYLTNIVKGSETDNGKVPVIAAAAAFSGWRWWNENDTLLKRMGELRYSEDDGGDWLRIARSKQEGAGFEGKTTMFQFGYDRRQEVENGIWRKGIALSRGETDADFQGGKGNIINTSLAAYATWLGKKDHYWDIVLKGSRLRNDYETYGKYSDHGLNKNWAASISAEYGRKKMLNTEGWFLEPQAQLTYGHMWGDDYLTEQDIKVRQDDSDSLVGRLGLVLSREMTDTENRSQRFYLKASVLHEFMGSDRFHLQDGRGETLYVENDLGGTWYEVGLGMNAVISDRTHLYLDIEKSFKGKIDTPYRIEAGVRWEF
jgi:hypothetical protein